MSLQGKTVAILIAPRGTEEVEFTQPKQAAEQAGANVVVVGIEAGTAKTSNQDVDPGGDYSVDAVVGDVSADAFDALIVPGGTVGADKLRGDQQIVAFVKAFFDQKKPVAVICHGPWLLIEAEVVQGRQLTSFATVRKDIVNAGGVWRDEAVVVDQGLVTSRDPDDLPAFCKKLVEEFAQGRDSRA